MRHGSYYDKSMHSGKEGGNTRKATKGVWYVEPTPYVEPCYVEPAPYVELWYGV